MSFLKIELIVKFNCQPEIIAYEINEESLQNNIKINEVIMKYDNNISEPYWNSSVIIEKTLSSDKLLLLLKRLYECSKFLLNSGKNDFNERVDNFKAPSDDDLIDIINKKISKNMSGITININEFKEQILNKTYWAGESLFTSTGRDVNIWHEYFDKKLKYDLLDKLLTRLTILKINNDKVEFKIKNNHIKTVDSIAKKLANDLIFILDQQK